MPQALAPQGSQASTTSNAKNAVDSENSERNNIYPNPESIPDRTILQPPTQEAIPEASASQEAPCAKEISADFTEQNILLIGTRRKARNARREAYFQRSQLATLTIPTLDSDSHSTPGISGVESGVDSSRLWDWRAEEN